MKGKLILPKDHQKLRNKANIYVGSAEDRSGLYRICYLRMEKDRIIVCEYKGSRGDQYSAYYKLLVNYLKERNIAIENTEQFELFESAMPILIECINLICEKGEEGQYRLFDTGKTYTRISNKKRHELPIKYYHEKRDSDETDDEDSSCLNEKYLAEIIHNYRMFEREGLDENQKYLDRLEILNRNLNRLAQISKDLIDACKVRRKRAEAEMNIEFE